MKVKYLIDLLLQQDIELDVCVCAHEGEAEMIDATEVEAVKDEDGNTVVEIR